MKEEQAQLPDGHPLVSASQLLYPMGAVAQRGTDVSDNAFSSGLFLQLPSSCFCCPSASRRSVKVSSPISCSRESALGSECRNITGRACSGDISNPQYLSHPLTRCVWSASVAQKLHGAFLSLFQGFLLTPLPVGWCLMVDRALAHA